MVLARSGWWVSGRDESRDVREAPDSTGGSLAALVDLVELYPDAT
jgi:hypothetical protein